LSVYLKTSLLSDLGESFKMSETLNHVLVSSRHEPYVLRSKSSRWRGADDTRIFRTNSYFRMCKEFYAPYFILFISNYLYLSLIISNYTSATALSYLCVRNAKILTLGILKTSFSLHSLNRIIAIEITRCWPAQAVNNLRARELLLA
jgi:hypothetical protein